MLFFSRFSFLANSLIMVLVMLVLIPGEASAQYRKDSLVLKNGNVIAGEIKQLDKGVLTMETDYSDKDFLIEWYGIREIYTKSNFLILLRDGRRLNGRLASLDATNRIAIRGTDSQLLVVTFRDLVYLKELKSDFWGRMKANIDFGLSLTKSNNLRQFSMRSTLGYLADKWQLNANYNQIRSVQDSVQPTMRIDAAVGYQYYLKRQWFATASLNFLSNDEQALSLRTSGKVGLGQFIWHTNKRYWGASAGASFNNEVFTNATPARQSLEAYLGSEMNLFDWGDLSLLSNVFVYKGITEGQRWRCDFKLDAKYDLPKDFYLKPGITINYDNQPAAMGKELDYVFVFNIGWEL